MSDQQIILFLSNTHETICGRFSEEQLNRQISIQDSPRRQPFVSIVAMLAALTVSVPRVQAESKREKMQLITDKSHVLLPPQKSDTLPLKIIGIVRDCIDSSAIGGATIKIKGQTIATIADSSGKFELMVPASPAEKYITLHVLSIGYASEEFTVPLTNHMYHLEMTKRYDVDVPQELTRPLGVIVSRRATLWERFKYKAKNIFR